MNTMCHHDCCLHSMQFAQLEGLSVAVWGAGREGRAALAGLRRHLPGQPVTVLCGQDEARRLATSDSEVRVCTRSPDADLLAAFDVVVKSPGISIYRPELRQSQARGTAFTSGTALWFGENPGARVIGITGTKGKSTTAALTAHLARAAGIRTALAGNIGCPLLELDGQQANLWVVELSSFQTGEAGALDVGVVTSLYEDHLDWHGSREQYVADKLQLADRAHTLIVNATQPELLARTAEHSRRVTFGDADGWHVTDGGLEHARKIAAEPLPDTLPGVHNGLNACAALTALEQAGVDATDLNDGLQDFQSLPHRLQYLGRAHGQHWINDSISTTPGATLAALDSLPGRAVTLIVGGHDRGVDWSNFVSRVTGRRDLRVIAQGDNGARIAAALDVENSPPVTVTPTLSEAVARARDISVADGCILLSPGAPSFDQFRDYTARGRCFARLVGFDSAAIGRIQGLGIA